MERVGRDLNPQQAKLKLKIPLIPSNESNPFCGVDYTLPRWILFAKYEASNMHKKSCPVQNLLACKKGLWLAHQWCDGPVILESDCSSCVVVFAEHENNHSIYAGLVEDSKNIMRMMENVCLFKIIES